jgi:peptidoglycan/LPS O-acetylase OafA/YrhL
VNGGTGQARAYQPALDGVRGVAVALVLLFHGGFAWMSGGYVGVSVFFTLSGFLITGLLLAEHDRTGRVSVRAFYGRRVRRLMPASLFCLAAVAVLAAFGRFGGLPHLRRDLLAALLQVANWNALAGGTSYADLIARNAGSLGPVDHFWSLSVEEQFYWIWPLVCAWLFARARRPHVRRNALVGLAVGAVTLAPLVAHVWGPDAAYWATPARLGEILVGAALAAVLHARTPAGRALPWLGLAGAAVVLWAAVTWPADRGPAYGGWLGVFALASAALILGLQVPGPLRTAFSAGPVVHLGRISYGVYLYHWPVYALLTATQVGLHGWSLFLVRLAVTLLVAECSFRLLEQPVRRGAGAPARQARNAVVAMVAVAALAMVVVPPPAPVFSGSTDVPATFAPQRITTAPATTVSSPVLVTSVPATSSSVAAAGLIPLTTVPLTTVPLTTVPLTTVASTTSTLPAVPRKVLLLGDSTGVALAEGLYRWAGGHVAQVQVASLARLGCGLVRRSAMFGDGGDRFRANCDHAFDVELPALLRGGVPDVVTVMVTLPDVVDRTWSTGEGPLRPSDARYTARMHADYDTLTDQLVAAGVRTIVWVVPPPPSDRWPQAKVKPIRTEDWAVFIGTIRREAVRHPDAVRLAPLDEWMAKNEPPDGSMRPDGLHLAPDAAFTVTERFLAPLLISRGT